MTTGRPPAPALRRTLATGAASMAVSPAPLVVTGAFYLMVTGVLAGLWSVAANANGGSIVGYSTTAIVWYLATSEMSAMSLTPRLIEDIGDDIGSGRILVEMLRPTSVLGMRLAGEVGSVLPRLGVCMVVGSVYAWVLGGRPEHGVALALAVPSLLLAVTLNLAVQHAFASAAFWLRDAKSTWFLYQKMVFVLGGMLLPLEVLPEWLQQLARVLPFMAMAYAPARLASGHFEPGLLLIQLAWLGAALVVARRLFLAGERRLVEVGG